MSSSYFNPRSPCGERRRPRQPRDRPRDISIHAPRAGSDTERGDNGFGSTDFNPRSPCGERLTLCASTDRPFLFQSTLPVRGATSGKRGFPIPFTQFQSTLPVRGATSAFCVDSRGCKISIHAPRAGSDYIGAESVHCIGHFNPRSPCGERRFWIAKNRANGKFQSTLPVRGATRTCGTHSQIPSRFQSTLPVRGATIDS